MSATKAIREGGGMDDGEALLKAILANPHDDVVRLVYADYLEENGERERAEFIRVQIESEKRPNWGLCGPGSFHTPWCASSHVNRHACNAHGAETDRIRNRVKELMKANWPKWGNEFSGPWTAHGWVSTRIMLSTPDNSSVAKVDFRRGFVDTMTCQSADWLQHADAIRERHPVTRVVLTTQPIINWRPEAKFVDNRYVVHTVYSMDGLYTIARGIPAEFTQFAISAALGIEGEPENLREVAAGILKIYYPGITFDLPPS